MKLHPIRMLVMTTVLACALGAAAPARAISVVPETDANALVSALLPAGSGITLLGASLAGQVAWGDDDSDGPRAVSSGIFTNASGTYGIGDGIVLSTGNVSDYGDGPDRDPDATFFYGVSATPGQKALADVVAQGNYKYFDVTQLDITFEMDPGFDAVTFELVFGSEEWPEFVGSRFIDGMGLFLDGVNLAQVNGAPVNINHPDMAAIAGTELDAVLAPDGDPLLRVTLGASDQAVHTLTLLIFDTSDSILDSTVYISALRAGSAGGGPPVPEPTTALLLGAGLAGLAAARRRAHSAR